MALDPALAALLSFGGGLAAAGGPSRMPTGMGQAVGQAGMGGLAGYMQAQQMAQQERLADLQALETAMKARQNRERQRAIGQMVAQQPEERRALAAAFPETFAEQQAKSMFAAPKPPRIETFIEGGQEIQKQWNPEVGEWVEVGRGSRWKPEPPPGTAEATAALKTRAGKIADYQRLGLDEQTATLLVDNNLDAIPTADGRLIARNPITGETQDITPDVRHGEMLEQQGTTAVGEDLGQTVGPGPRASEVASKYLGGFIAGAGDPNIDEKRQNLRLLERQSRSAFTLSSRPSQWEQSLIKEMFPSEGFFESPERASRMLRQLKAEAASTYNDYEEALRDPGVTGNLRSEMKQKQIELKRLYDSIQIPDSVGQQAAPEEAPAAPEVGTIEEGYRFLGGNPADPGNWEAVR